MLSNQVSSPAREKELLFIAAYWKDPAKDGQAAAIAAGYSPRGAAVRANEILKRPHVQAELARLQLNVSNRTARTLADVVAELEKIAFSNTLDFSKLTPDGDLIPDFSNLTREQAAAISEIQIDTYVDGKGEDAREVKRVRVKLHDKKGALVDLGKHLGGFVNKSKTELTGPDGNPMQVDNRIIVTYVKANGKR